MYDIYMVEEGDTLDSLSDKFNISKDKLKELNSMSTFTPGTNIIIPKENEFFEVYIIKKGDNLYDIARRYNTDYNLLALLNGLNISDYIYPNMTLLVPKKNVKYYITKENDTLSNVNKLLSGNINNLLNQNKNIYLKEGQLIVYKD